MAKARTGRGKSSKGNSGNKAGNNYRKSIMARRARRITRMYDRSCRTKLVTRKQTVLAVQELSEHEINAISESEMDEQHDHLDELMENEESESNE